MTEREPTELERTVALAERIKRDAEELERLCREIPGLRELCGEFQVEFPPTRLSVLKSPDSALGGKSPLELLIMVRDAIRIYGEMGS